MGYRLGRTCRPWARQGAEKGSAARSRELGLVPDPEVRNGRRISPRWASAWPRVHPNETSCARLQQPPSGRSFRGARRFRTLEPLQRVSLRSRAAVAQLVERQLPKLNVESSNLFGRSILGIPDRLGALCVPGRLASGIRRRTGAPHSEVVFARSTTHRRCDDRTSRFGLGPALLHPSERSPHRARHDGSGLGEGLRRPLEVFGSIPRRGPRRATPPGAGPSRPWSAGSPIGSG